VKPFRSFNPVEAGSIFSLWEDYALLLSWVFCRSYKNFIKEGRFFMRKVKYTFLNPNSDKDFSDFLMKTIAKAVAQKLLYGEGGGNASIGVDARSTKTKTAKDDREIN
jgi:hypothetical protein